MKVKVQLDKRKHNLERLDLVYDRTRLQVIYMYMSDTLYDVELFTIQLLRR